MEFPSVQLSDRDQLPEANLYFVSGFAVAMFIAEVVLSSAFAVFLDHIGIKIILQWG